MDIKRGELYYADLSPVIGSEQGGIRPILVIQNDIGNKYSPTIIAAAITSKLNKAKLPTHIELSANIYGLEKDSVVLLEQIRTLDKKRLKAKIGELEEYKMNEVNRAMLISLGVVWKKRKFLFYFIGQKVTYCFKNFLICIFSLKILFENISNT